MPKGGPETSRREIKRPNIEYPQLIALAFAIGNSFVVRYLSLSSAFWYLGSVRQQLVVLSLCAL
jgi:hypothetical protein